uniref:uncharacterized protein LOC122590719 n=1 Tax=Erigeron canadensis TaxID=72917 RepID=UPI001CB90793|nr:uncharacterized protein LOC122590719 [Erigeron canadensis]
MTKFHITKKWRKKVKILRAIIHGSLGNNAFIATEDHKVHNNFGDNECSKKIKDDDKKQSTNTTTNVSCKVGMLARVPSRGLNGLRKVGRAVSMRKHEEEEGKEDEGDELCKKRIMMGNKCRPLNVSGSLHYDKNGVLVPEVDY